MEITNAKKLKYSSLILLLIFSLFPCSLVKAVGIQVFPPELKIEAKKRDPIEKDIIIKNPGNDVTLYEIYVDDFSDWIAPNVSSFILEGKESKKVTLVGKGKETGVFLTNVSIVAKPLLEGEFRVNAGVKIPLDIRIVEIEGRRKMFLAFVSDILNKEIKIKLSFFILSLIFVLSFLIFIVTRRLRRGKKNN